MTPVILFEIVATTSHLSEAFSSPSDPGPNPPGPSPSIGPPTTTLSPEVVRAQEVELKQNLVMALSSLSNEVMLSENTTELKVETENIIAQVKSKIWINSPRWEDLLPGGRFHLLIIYIFFKFWIGMYSQITEKSILNY